MPLDELRASWKWFVAVGAALIALGTLGEMTAALTTPPLLGWLLLLGGGVALVQPLRTRTWSGSLLLSALLRGFTGGVFIRYPSSAGLGPTLSLASLLLVGGTFRLLGAGALKFPTWHWAAFSGLLSITLGAMLIGWPTASLSFLGCVAGIDFAFEGAALIALGSALYSIPTYRSVALSTGTSTEHPDRAAQRELRACLMAAGNHYPHAPASRRHAYPYE
jgi:uncharacterized membrane protein HdeD (DUF308 family)